MGGPTTPFVLVVASGADIPNSTGASLVSNPRPRLRLCRGPRRLSPATLFEADPSRRPHLLVPGQQRDPSRGCACFGHSVISTKRCENLTEHLIPPPCVHKSSPFTSPCTEGCRWCQACSNFLLLLLFLGSGFIRQSLTSVTPSPPILQMKGSFCTVARIFN